MPEPMADPTPATEGGGQNPLTRKLGPLPAWGWALAIAGGFIAFRLVRGQGAFPSGGGGTSSQVGAVTSPVVPGSESSIFGSNPSASDISALAQALKQAEAENHPPSTAAPPAKAVDFAGSKTAFGTRYPSYIHTLADAIRWYFTAIHNGAKPKTAFSTVPIH